MPEEVKSAVLSSDQRYRYLLTRQWDAGKQTATFLMLNPSTADASSDDATTRSCREIAKHAGFGGMIFTNLYALRSKDPSVLYGADDPVGPENDESIRWAAGRSDAIVLAWGNLGPTVRAGRIGEVLAHLRNYWGQVYALGITAQGQPTHPRFLAATTRLRRFDVEAYLRHRPADEVLLADVSAGGAS